MRAFRSFLADGLARLDRSTRFSLLGLTLAALAGGAVMAWTIFRLNDDTEWVKHTQDVVETIAQVQIALTDAETGQRGYLLTGDRRYLAPYETAGAAVDAALSGAITLTADNPTQNRRVRELRPLIEAKLAELAETIALFDAGRPDASLNLVRSNEGQQLMEQFREDIEQIVAEERRLLAERDAARDRTRSTGYLTAALLTTAQVLTLATAAWMLSRFLQQIELARRRAEAASRSRGEFLANMSHEIRTPMTAILGYADILRDRAADPDDRQLADTITSNGQHLLRILNDILDLSKIDAGRLTVQRELVPLQPLAADLQSTLAVLASRKAIAFNVSFETPVPQMLNTDPVRLRQILINLVGNAIKFTDRGHVHVRFAYEPEAKVLVVRVVDSGSGIEARHLETIFAPFEQYDGSFTRRHEGTGLGLAICRRLAEALGGSISVESEVGRGSTFELRLDCRDLTDVDLVHASLTVKREKPPAVALRGDELPYRVLVVDDRREIRFLVRRLVERAGGTVVEAENGSEALTILLEDEDLETSIDVCVLDMQMPILDGVETARSMRRRGFVQPIIALTANTMAEDRQRCLEAGFNDYLSKPIDAGELIAKLSQWSRKRQGSPSASRPPLA